MTGTKADCAKVNRCHFEPFSFASEYLSSLLLLERCKILWRVIKSSSVVSFLVYAVISTYHRWKFIHISESFFCSTECVTSDIESLVSFSFRCSCHNTRLVFPIDIFTFFSLLSLVLNVVLFHSPASFLTNCKLILWVFIYSTECVARRRRWKWKGMDRVAVEIAPHLRLFWHFPLFLIPINMNRQHQHGMLTSSRQFTGLAMRWAWELNTIGERKSQINFLRHAINQADLYRLIKIDTQNFFCSMSISAEDSKRFIIYSMEIHQGRKFCVWNFQNLFVSWDDCSWKFRSEVEAPEALQKSKGGAENKSTIAEWKEGNFKTLLLLSLLENLTKCFKFHPTRSNRSFSICIHNKFVSSCNSSSFLCIPLKFILLQWTIKFTRSNWIFLGVAQQLDRAR